MHSTQVKEICKKIIDVLRCVKLVTLLSVLGEQMFKLKNSYTEKV